MYKWSTLIIKSYSSFPSTLRLIGSSNLLIYSEFKSSTHGNTDPGAIKAKLSVIFALNTYFVPPIKQLGKGLGSI